MSGSKGDDNDNDDNKNRNKMTTWRFFFSNKGESRFLSSVFASLRNVVVREDKYTSELTYCAAFAFV